MFACLLGNSHKLVFSFYRATQSKSLDAFLNFRFLESSTKVSSLLKPAILQVCLNVCLYDCSDYICKYVCISKLQTLEQARR